MAHFEVSIANDHFYVLLAVEALDAAAAEMEVTAWLATPEGQALGEADAREGEIVGNMADANFCYRVFRVRERAVAVSAFDKCGPFGMIDSGGNG